MVKNILSLSMVASLALFTIGCGGGDGGSSDSNQQQQQDTTAPVITTASPIDAVEESNTTVTLSANEANVTFSIVPADHFSLSGNTLAFAAPAYETNGTNAYNVIVKATDAAGNEGNKTLTFNVTPMVIKAVSTGDKNLTVEGNVVIGPRGKKWLNDNAPIMDYDAAVQYCEDADNGSGYRIARRDEILDLMDYETDNDRALENEFVNDKSIAWAKKTNDTYFYVNLNAGADGEAADGSATYSVLCVKGKEPKQHIYTTAEVNGTAVVKDETAKLVWTKVQSDQDEERRAITPDDNEVPGVNPQPAADYCQNGFRLPTINELRTLVDYEQNTVNSDVVPARTDNAPVTLWSSTQDLRDHTNIAKNFHIDNQHKGVISTDPQTTPYFVSCVKEAE